ncbi:hypothetical protein PsorP6_015374 [Peronosclerospora sorghi]|uniref:Uncharacterized protein n=1 Tax=Peronosclerospora sorghi TaxID=230839 RepID=A0ACC0WQ05_9STRA|nr:hypothetical protein PsorP6_015374 [Peronosclerospora sorghi]
MVESAPLYIHNVYAPLGRQEKQYFFWILATDKFEDHATHFVLGDLNTPLDPLIDSSSLGLSYDPGRSRPLECLAKVFPRYLLEYPMLVSAIEEEYEIVRDSVRSVTNPGALVDKADSWHRDSSSISNREPFDAAMTNYKDTVTRTSQYNQDITFDFQEANSKKTSKNFIIRLNTSLRRVSIEEVMRPSGCISTNHQEIVLRFLEHWVPKWGPQKPIRKNSSSRQCQAAQTP